MAVRDIVQAAAGLKTLTPIPTPISDNFILWLEGENWDGTTWTATKGTNPTKNGTISASTTNGFDSALFGSDGCFTISSFVAPSHISVFAVLNEPSGVPLIVEQSTNANSQNGFYFYTNDYYPYNVYRSSVGTALRFNPDPVADWFGAGLGLGAINFDGSTFTLRKDSSDVTTSVAVGSISSYSTSTNATDTLYIGSRNASSLFFSGGHLCELIISPDLSSADFTTVTDYLVAKYGL